MDFPRPCQVTRQIRSFTFGNPSSARSPVRQPVHPSAAPSARPHACPPSRPPVRMPARPHPSVRPSAHCPPPSARLPVHPPASPSAHPLGALVRLCAHPSTRPPVRRSPPVRPPSAPFTSSKNYLPVSSGPKFFTSCTPREIATSAIWGASRSHSGIKVSKLPPLRGQS